MNLKPLKHLLLPLCLSAQGSSEQLCPTWTGRPGTSTCSSSRPKTWWARWEASPAPPLSPSRSQTSTTTRLASLTVSLQPRPSLWGQLNLSCSRAAIGIKPAAPAGLCNLSFNGGTSFGNLPVGNRTQTKLVRSTHLVVSDSWRLNPFLIHNLSKSQF